MRDELHPYWFKRLYLPRYFLPLSLQSNGVRLDLCAERLNRVVRRAPRLRDVRVNPSGIGRSRGLVVAPLIAIAPLAGDMSPEIAGALDRAGIASASV